jgi:predicted DNA-binding protein (MmcQ/YjbR family)
VSAKTDYAALRSYMLDKPSTIASYPFGEGTLVFKVVGKMFALIAEDADPLRINLKCDPDDALALRAKYAAIIPGYHMNKRHWNTLILDGSLPAELVYELVDHSYELVVQGLSKSKREMLKSSS